MRLDVWGTIRPCMIFVNHKSRLHRHGHSHQADHFLEQGLSTVQQVLETQHQRARIVPEEENRTAPPPAQLHVHGHGHQADHVQEQGRSAV